MDYVGIAEAHFGVSFKRISNDEYFSLDGCPWCGNSGKAHGKSDRFRLFLDGSPRVWCRQCDKRMFMDSLEGLDENEILRIRVESIERRQLETEREVARVKSAVEEMKACVDYIRYHSNLLANEQAFEAWMADGFTRETIAQRELGYCHQCPTAPYSDSLTIPIKYMSQLYNIRHRLLSPNGNGKYRPHMTGLPGMIYNADDLNRDDSQSIMLLEGEKKSIMLAQEMPYEPNIATMGMQGFKKAWVPKLDRFKRIYVIFDPDATDKAGDVASWFQGRGRVVELPVKADDFFLLGGNPRDFIQYIELARPA